MSHPGPPITPGHEYSLWVPPDVVAVLGRGPVDPAIPTMFTDDLGLSRGDGCFEGCRVRRSGRDVQVDDLEQHLDRMGSSARGLGIAFDQPAWRALVESALDEWDRACADREEASLKLVLTRGREGSGEPTGFASISRLPESTVSARREGIKAITLARGVHSDAFADRPWLLGGVKTLSYAVNMAALREALRRGADDAIFVSSDGRVLEATTAAVVWVNGRRISTVPAGANGILPSITAERLLQEAVAAGFTAGRAQASVDELSAADAVMLVSSVRGPVLVRSIDGRDLTPTEAGMRALSTSQRRLQFSPPATGTG